MRILVVTAALPPARTPEGEYILIAANQLAKRGHDVTVLTTKGHVADHPDVTVLPLMKDWSWSSLPRMASALRRLKPDAILLMYVGWIYDFHPMVTMLLSISRRLLPQGGFLSVIPQVAGAHELRTWLRVARPLSRVLRTSPPQPMFGTLLADSDAVLTFSESMRRRLQEMAPAARPEIWVAPPPSMLRRATDPAAARLQVRRRLGIPKDTFLFTSFGCMYGSKGLEYLLRALPAVIAGTDKDVRLMFLGGVLDGLNSKEYVAMLREMAATIGVMDRIIWAGEFDRDLEDASAALYASDAAAFPLIDGVQMSNSSVVAALVHGLPLVTTASNLTDALFEDGANVLLVPPRDPDSLAKAMLRMIREPETMARLKEGAQSTGKTWPDSAELGRLIERRLSECTQHRGR